MSSRQATGVQVAPRGIENESTETQEANASLHKRESSPSRKSKARFIQALHARAKSDSSLKRIELRATDEFLSALDALASKENLTRADIIRRGVGLYARMIVEKEKGQFLGVVAVEYGQLTVKEVVHA